MTAALRTTLSMTLPRVAGPVAVLVAVLTCWLVPPAAAGATAPAGAADCPPIDLSTAAAVRSNTADYREHAEAVTDVFAGQVKAVQARTTSGGGEDKANQDGTQAPTTKPDVRTTAFEHRVLVKKPFRSSTQPGDMVLVVTTPTADDGLGRLQEDTTYLFFVTDQRSGDLLAEPCSGTQPVRYDADLRDALAAALDDPDDDPVPDYTLTTPDDGARSTPALGRLAAPGAAVALIGVLGLLVLARVGSRRT